MGKILTVKTNLLLEFG